MATTTTVPLKYNVEGSTDVDQRLGERPGIGNTVAVLLQVPFPKIMRNPFRTACIRPGAMPYLFPPGENAESLVARLRQNGWRGEIVGPHGTGKSALLAALIPAVEQAGRSVLHIALHDGSGRRWSRVVSKIDILLQCSNADSRRPAPLLALDGYEQLSRWQRHCLARRCRRRGWGLLVTAHASTGLPPLWKTAATPELALRIVEQLTGGRPMPFSRAELAERLARRGGNLREMLFDLYDLYESPP